LDPITISDLLKVNDAFPTQWVGRLNDNRLIWIEYDSGMLRISKSYTETDDAYEAINGIVVYNLCLSHDLNDSFIIDYDLFKILEELEILKLSWLQDMYYFIKEDIINPIREMLFGPTYFFVISSEEYEDEDTEENDSRD
jgi:hypothetical protein